LLVVFAFLLSSAVFVLIDSVYFGWLHLELFPTASSSTSSSSTTTSATSTSADQAAYLAITSWSNALKLLRGDFGWAAPLSALLSGQFDIKVCTVGC
jgi:hypothetical protein